MRVAATYGVEVVKELDSVKRDVLHFPLGHLQRTQILHNVSVDSNVQFTTTYYNTTWWWLGSRMVSVLDSGAVGPGFILQPRRCRVTVLGKLFTPIVCALFAKHWKLVAALLRVARVTAGLAESNGSLPPGLWLTSPAGWLPRTGVSSGTLRSVIEYGLPLPFFITRLRFHVHQARRLLPAFGSCWHIHGQYHTRKVLSCWISVSII